MDEPKSDNVIKFVAKRGDSGRVSQLTPARTRVVSAEVLERERRQIIKLLTEVAEDQPAPISHVYKALAQMAMDAPLPTDLRLDYPIGNGDGPVLMLVNFTAHPGVVRTSIHVGNVDKHRNAEEIPYEGRAAVEAEFKELGPDFTVYQVYSLRPSFVLINALMGYGLNLESIQRPPQRAVFGFTYRSPEGVYPVTVTVHIPHGD